MIAENASINCERADTMRKSFFLLTLIVLFMMMHVIRVQAQPTITQQISISQDHFVLQPLERGVGIREILIITNSDDQPYIGTASDASDTSKQGWLFSLPQGFTSLSIDALADEEYRIVKDGVLVYKPLAPGSTTLVMSYTIPAENLPVTLTKNVVYTTTSLLVVSPQSFTISSDKLQPGETFEIKGAVYQEYSVQNLAPGQSLTYAINQGSGTATVGNRIASGYAVTGHPQYHIAFFKSEPLVYTNAHLWAVYLFIMVALGIGSIVLIARMRKKTFQEKTDSGIQFLDSAKIEEVDEEETFLKFKHMNDTLLVEIKSLDSEFASGKIPEERYHDLRSQKKKMLTRVKIMLKDLAE